MNEGGWEGGRTGGCKREAKQEGGRRACMNKEGAGARAKHRSVSMNEGLHEQGWMHTRGPVQVGRRRGRGGGRGARAIPFILFYFILLHTLSLFLPIHI